MCQACDLFASCLLAHLELKVAKSCYKTVAWTARTSVAVSMACVAAGWNSTAPTPALRHFMRLLQEKEKANILVHETKREL